VTSSDPLLNRILGDYTITRLIAKGGMGRVYEATDTQLNRQVAVKVITLDEDVADELMLRFRREARVIGQLDDHPNIITIYRYGKEDGVHYIAMKFVRGQSLAEYIKHHQNQGTRIATDEMLDILRQVAAALDHAHAHGVIHRDVKPANVMLERDPSLRAILMDFGLVMHVDSTMTTGSAFGTPRYIAPEQALSSFQACEQSDIYALGVITYEMMTGTAPFDEGETPIAIALSHVTKSVPSPRGINPDIPEAAEKVLLKALEKKPQDRYQRASEFIAALERALKTGRGATGIVPTLPDAIFNIDRDKPTAQVDISAIEAVPKREKAPPEIFITGEYSPIRRDYLLPSAVVLGVLLVAAALVYFALVGRTEKTAAVATEVPQSTPADTPATDDPTPVAPAVATNGAVMLLYSDNLLIIRNTGGRSLDLRGVELRAEDGRIFSLGDLGQSALASWQPGQCAYVTLVGTDYEKPENCTTERAPLRYLNATDFVWQADFSLYQEGRKLGACAPDAASCIVNGIKQP